MRAALRVVTTIVDRWWNPLDRRLGTVTDRWVAEEDIADEVGGDHGRHSASYTAIVSRSLRGALAEAVPNPTGTFVDLGSGRGRTLLIALEHGFDRAVGVEHSRRLARAAEENLVRSGLLGGESWQGDASEVELPPETEVVFMYNPFTPEVWQRVLDGPIARLPRSVVLLAHAMPHVLTVTSTAVGTRHEQTIWSAGREFFVVRTLPRHQL